MNETTVTVVGNIASDVTTRRVGPDERAVVSFRIVSNARRRDRVSGDWIDGDRVSAKVTCWRRLGEHVRDALVKGDPVVVIGRLSVREYEADGERRWSTEIEAIAVGPNLDHCTAQVKRRRSEEVGSEQTEQAAEPARPTDVPWAGGSRGDGWGHALETFGEDDPVTEPLDDPTEWGTAASSARVDENALSPAAAVA